MHSGVGACLMVIRLGIPQRHLDAVPRHADQPRAPHPRWQMEGVGSTEARVRGPEPLQVAAKSPSALEARVLFAGRERRASPNARGVSVVVRAQSTGAGTIDARGSSAGHPLNPTCAAFACGSTVATASQATQELPAPKNCSLDECARRKVDEAES